MLHPGYKSTVPHPLLFSSDRWETTILNRPFFLRRSVKSLKFISEWQATMDSVNAS